MSFTILSVAQRSDEWRTLRAGRLTSSRAGDAIHFLKDGKSESAARRDYRIDLVAERLMNAPIDSDFSNRDTERGVELEPAAIAAYELHTGQMVQPVGFVIHGQHPAGYSPDGAVGEGWVEAKCPRPANHLKYLRAGVVPVDHLAQLTHAIWLTDAPWIDFISYSPVFPDHLRLFVVRLNRDAVAIAEYEAKALRFLEEVHAEHQALLRPREAA